jgi:hypothetical protein
MSSRKRSAAAAGTISSEALQLGLYDALADLGRRADALGGAARDFAWQVGDLVQAAVARHADGALSDDGLRKVLESARQALESKAAQLAPDLARVAQGWLGTLFGALGALVRGA